MKKLLLSILVATAGTVSAQMLQSENFNTLTVGNVATDITGATPGQGDWLIATSNGTAPTTGTNAAADNFQIVTSGFDATNGLKITSSNGNKGSRFMWKDGLDLAWADRTTGNDIIEVEYDLYTGAATSSTAQVGVRLYGMDGTNTRTLNGFVYNMGSRVLQGVCYLNNGGSYGNYLITLQTGGLILDADTWYRIGFAYDTTSGETIWKAGAVYTGLPAANWAGPFDPNEVDFVSAVPTTNAEASEMIFDNLTVKATATEALLGTAEIEATQNSVSVFPNPAQNTINIKGNSLGFNAITITDANGRAVKTLKIDTTTETQMNISDLAPGVYFMAISSEAGSVTKKIVKQ